MRKSEAMSKAAYTLPARSPSIEAAKVLGAYIWQPRIEKFLGNGRCIIGNKEMLILSGYSYLGLAVDSTIEARASELVKDFGLGSYGSRIATGTTALHETLEKEIADLVGCESAVIFPTGYAANLSTIQALVQPGDVVVADQLVHASIVDGMKISGAEVRYFKHNSVSGLDLCLRETKSFNSRLVVIDAVYSMDGDIALLPEIAEVCKKYDAGLMVDECHSFLVIGDLGRGMFDLFPHHSPLIDIKIVTLSKAIPSIGGCAAGSEELVSYLKEHARTYIFSGATPPYAAACALATIEKVKNEPSIFNLLKHKADRFRVEIRKRGLETGSSQTPIIPIYIGDEDLCILLSKWCFDRGVLALPVIFPAVPRGKSRLRIAVCADHENGDLDAALDVICEGYSHLIKHLDQPFLQSQG